ncbi:hypothetical protein NFJ02_26g61050 [Pycnococcus provasolii]
MAPRTPGRLLMSHMQQNHDLVGGSAMHRTPLRQPLKPFDDNLVTTHNSESINKHNLGNTLTSLSGKRAARKVRTPLLFFAFVSACVFFF